MDINEKLKKVLETMDEIIGSIPDVAPADGEFTLEFQPVAELKVGDKLRYKGGMSVKFPEKGGLVNVYSLSVPSFQSESGHEIKRCDFTILGLWSDGDVKEYAMDSRYFERA